MNIKQFLFFFLILVFPAIVNATPIQINDRNLLAANDFVDWGTFGPAFTLVPDGSTVNSIAGNTLTINNTIEPGTPFGVFQQIPPVMTGFWNGNFAPGDSVLAPNGRPGATLIQFSNPVAGVGAQVQGSLLGTPFTAFLNVMDIDGLVFTFTAFGTSTSDADNSAIFLGVLNEVANIVSIEYSVTSQGLGTNGTAINQLDIQSVPEPDNILLLCFGLGFLGLSKLRKTAN